MRRGLRIGQEGEICAAILDGEIGQGLPAGEDRPQHKPLGLGAVGVPGVATDRKMHAEPGVDGHQVGLGGDARLAPRGRTVVALAAIEGRR